MSEPVIFRPDRATYWRDHAIMAAAAMAAGMAVLWLMENPYIWTGAIGGLAAIGIRAVYLAPEELGAEWRLEGGALNGPGGRHVALGDIAALRSLGSAVQIVTKGGDKHLMKYMSERDAVIAQIEAAR